MIKFIFKMKRVTVLTVRRSYQDDLFVCLGLHYTVISLYLLVVKSDCRTVVFLELTDETVVTTYLLT